MSDVGTGRSDNRQLVVPRETRNLAMTHVRSSSCPGQAKRRRPVQRVERTVGRSP